MTTHDSLKMTGRDGVSFSPFSRKPPGYIFLVCIWGIYLFGATASITSQKWTALTGNLPPLPNRSNIIIERHKLIRQLGLSKGIRHSNDRWTIVWNYRNIGILIVLLLGLCICIFLGKAYDLAFPFVLGAIISSNGTGGGDFDAAGTWSGGSIPGTNDDAIIVSGDTVTMVQNESINSMEIQSGGDLDGAGYLLVLNGENAAGYAFDHDGTISNALDVLVSTGSNTNIDLAGTSGNVANLEIAMSDTCTFVGNSVLDGSLTVTGGTLVPNSNTDTLTIAGNLQVEGTLGSAGWTGDLRVGGDLSGNGTYTHGNQEVIADGAAVQQIVEGSWAFYDLTVSSGESLSIDDNSSVSVDHILTISASSELKILGGVGITNVQFGTASAAATIDNSGTLIVDTSGGNVEFFGYTTSYHCNLTGAGVYDWDYGVGNTLEWKWLVHKGTDATAKTTGGGGQAIKLMGRVDFWEDFAFELGDTVNFNNQTIGIKKNLSASATMTNRAGLYLLSAGTGTIYGWSGTSLVDYSDGDYSWSGTMILTGTITWGGVAIGALFPYDATSAITLTNGVTIPAGAFFGSDALGMMGDGNPISGWTAAQSWGWIDNAGNLTLPRAILTLTGQTGGYCIQNSGTLTHNNCTLKPSSSTAHQGISNSVNDPLYRLYNNNTYSSTVTFNHDTSLDGIWFTTGTVTEAATGVTVTLTGYTPALGSVGPFTHDELETSGRLKETGTGVFVFNYECPAEVGTSDFRVLYTTSDTQQYNVVDVYVLDAMDRYSRMAEIYLDDPDGAQAANYDIGDPVRIMYHDGTEWITRWRGMCTDINDAMRDGPCAIITCYGFDIWLRKRKITMSFTHRDHSLHELLQVLVQKYTPITWDATLIDTSSNPTTIQIEFQGVTIDEAIGQLLGYSDNEEYFVDDNFKFNVRQRATAFGGSYDAPETYDLDNITDIDIETLGSDEVNRVIVYYGPSLDDMVAREDTARQTDLQTAAGASQPVVIEMEYQRKDITTSAQAIVYADYKLNTKRTQQRGTLHTYDSRDVYPGMITQVTNGYKDDYAVATDFKIISIAYTHSRDEAVLTISEPDLVLPRVSRPGFNRAAGGQKFGEQLVVSGADSSFGMQGTEWDSEADFNLWALGVNEQVNVGGYIECSGATAGAETCTSPWISPGTAKAYVWWWWLARFIITNNDGTIDVYVEGSVMGRVAISDYEDLRALAFDPTEDLRFSIDFTWDGAGTSPTFEYGGIFWK